MAKTDRWNKSRLRELLREMKQGIHFTACSDLFLAKSGPGVREKHLVLLCQVEEEVKQEASILRKNLREVVKKYSK